MPVMGVGSDTNVERRMPIGEGVMVILMESSMSVIFVISQVAINNFPAARIAKTTNLGYTEMCIRTGNHHPPLRSRKPGRHGSMRRRFGRDRLHRDTIPIIMLPEVVDDTPANRTPSTWPNPPYAQSSRQLQIHSPRRRNRRRKQFQSLGNRFLGLRPLRVFSLSAKTELVCDVRHRLTDVLAGILLEVCNDVLGLPWLRGMRVDVYRAVGRVVEEPYGFGGRVEVGCNRVVRTKVG